MGLDILCPREELSVPRNTVGAACDTHAIRGMWAKSGVRILHQMGRYGMRVSRSVALGVVECIDDGRKVSQRIGSWDESRVVLSIGVIVVMLCVEGSNSVGRGRFYQTLSLD